MQVYEIETQDFIRYSADADCSIFHDKLRKHYRVEWQDGTLITVPESKVINVAKTATPSLINSEI